MMLLIILPILQKVMEMKEMLELKEKVEKDKRIQMMLKYLMLERQMRLISYRKMYLLTCGAFKNDLKIFITIRYAIIMWALFLKSAKNNRALHLFYGFSKQTSC